METKDIKYIIFPDIHGRTFWKETFEKYITEENIMFIFLGDYLDPYEYEEIEDEYSNFLEIIEYKKKYSDRIILLLGNHDIHYLTRAGRGSRWDWSNAERNKKTILDNLNLFQVIYTTIVNDKKFLFSHAGVLKDWVYYNHKWFNIEVPDDNRDYKISDWTELPDFNKFLRTDIDELFKSNNTSFERGGDSQWGSIFWADVHEHIDEYERIPGVIQVFGHTQQEHDPINIDDVVYCLDCRRPFVLTSDGNIVELTGASINKYNTDEYKKKQKERTERLLKLAAFFI